MLSILNQLALQKEFAKYYVNNVFGQKTQKHNNGNLARDLSHPRLECNFPATKAITKHALIFGCFLYLAE